MHALAVNSPLPVPMKTLTLFLAGVLVSVPISSAEDAQTPAALAKFPQLEFKRDADFKAEIHNAKREGFARPINGRPNIGFRFQTPDWIDGPVEWFAFAQPALAGEWLVFDAEATLVVRVGSQPVEDTPTATRSSIPASDLKGGAAYTVVRPLAEGESPPDGLAITVASVRGRFAFGDLSRNFELPERLLSVSEVLSEMLRIRSGQGNEAGAAYFGEQLDKRANLRGTYDQLYRAAWSNAQRGTGREDPAWAALIFDEIFTRSWHHRYYAEALSVLGNTVMSLRTADRHGRAAELLAWWHEAQLLGGYIMDPSAYPDLGPALEFLPEVRRREIPALGAFSQAEFPGDKPRTLQSDFRHYSANAFIIYAGHLNRSGQWRDAMEWAYWIMELSEHRYKEEKHDAGSNWNGALNRLATMVKVLGFHEQALQLSEMGLSSLIRGGYRERMPLIHESMKYACLIDLGRSSPDIIKQLETLVEKMRANHELVLNTPQDAEVTLAKAMILHGRVAEGEALLDRLVGENHRNARLARVSHWISIGRAADVESELIALLHHSRETGNKLWEINLYRMYADFLESQGRLEEALAIRREAVRLCRSFDYFTFLPGELAKLARLLDRLGNRSDAESAADEARGLLAQNRLPAHLADAARAILAGFTPRSDDPDDEEDSSPGIDFQPTRSVVIPVEGAAWSTHLTLQVEQRAAGVERLDLHDGKEKRRTMFNAGFLFHSR